MFMLRKLLLVSRLLISPALKLLGMFPLMIVTKQLPMVEVLTPHSVAKTRFLVLKIVRTVSLCLIVNMMTTY